MYQKTNKSLEKGINVIELLYEKGELGITEIADITRWSKSNCHKLLETWKKYGYVLQNSITKKYKIGWRFLEVGSKLYRGYEELRQLVHQYMVELTKKTGENANLAVIDGRRCIYIDRVQTKQVLRPELDVGDSCEAHLSAVGKCLLSQLSEEEIDILYPEENLQVVTPRSIKTKTQLKEAIVQVRKLGYATDLEELSEGVICIGVPILDYTGKVQAALSISAPAQRFNQKRIDYSTPILLETAGAISKKLGYTGLNP